MIEYRKVVFLIISILNDKNLLREVGFGESYIILINFEFKNILLEEFENYLEYVKDQEEGIIEKFLNK